LAKKDEIKVSPDLKLGAKITVAPEDFSRSLQETPHSPPASRASLEDMERIRPGPGAAAQAAGSNAGQPPAPLSGALNLTGADIQKRWKEDKLVQSVMNEEGGGVLSEERLRTWGPLAAATVAARFSPALARQIASKSPLVPAIAGPKAVGAGLFGLGGFFSEYAIRLFQGQDWEEAIKPSAATGLGFVGADLAAAPILKNVGKLYVGTRGVIKSTSDRFRVMSGKRPRPDISGPGSSSAPFRRKLRPGGEEAFNTIMEVGGQPRPGHLTTAAFATTTQSILDKSFVTMGRQQDITDMNIKLLLGGLDSVVNQMPRLPFVEMRKLFQRIVQKDLAAVKGVAKTYHEAGDRIAGKTMIKVPREIIEEVPMKGPNGQIVRDSNGRQMTETVTRTVEDLVPAYGVDMRASQAVAKKELSQLESGNRSFPTLEAQLKRFIDSAPIQTISAASQKRTELFIQSKQFSIAENTIMTMEKGIAARLTGPLSKDLYKAIDNAPPEARAFYREGKRLTAQEVHGDLTSKFITKLANTQSDDFLEAMIVAGNAEQTIMLRNIIMKNDPQAWATLQGAFMRNLMYKHSKMNAIGGDIVASDMKASAVLDDLGRIAREDGSGISALFPNRNNKAGKIYRNFTRYMQAIKLQQEIAPGGGGGMLVQLKQAAVISGVIGVGASTVGLAFGASPSGAALGGLGALGATAAVVTLGPMALGRMWENDTMTTWLTIGAKNAPATLKAMRASVALIGLLLKENLFDTPEESKRAAQYAIETSKRIGQMEQKK